MEASGTEVAACGAGQRKSEKRSAGKDGFGRGYFRGSSPYLSGSRDISRLFHLGQKKRDSYPYPVHCEPGNFTMMYIRDLSFCQIEIFFIFGS